MERQKCDIIYANTATRWFLYHLCSHYMRCFMIKIVFCRFEWKYKVWNFITPIQFLQVERTRMHPFLWFDCPRLKMCSERLLSIEPPFLNTVYIISKQEIISRKEKTLQHLQHRQQHLQRIVSWIYLFLIQISSRHVLQICKYR